MENPPLPRESRIKGAGDASGSGDTQRRDMAVLEVEDDGAGMTEEEMGGRQAGS